MTAQPESDRLDTVAPGDLISLPLPDAPPAEDRQYKVVHIDRRGASADETMLITLEADDGQTFDVELPGDTVVTRTLESKWESPQSPTQNQG
ncbi:hypothetical protein [Mycolicibacterium vaccae]|jgi:hypothetical protein|uniref:Oxidoreductase, FAD-linked n=1 Tax=Mycolicibacterium vaccae ATCC 25954 TaxID=1194972 RepID=K0UL39_MYCVA|nr:hypothetical protein [Mycolicibacterium vaccae]ANI42744.1 hypothetical protein MYVA_5716 [Mycolicibacterium vaccae 95051]EJZ07481.1 hypothetical protein MVAC_18460 [Mycolicibacterium vaccae ATCC 25954]MCV7062867.1 hypothetical protein [Mycolicibacterium vaccae]